MIDWLIDWLMDWLIDWLITFYLLICLLYLTGNYHDSLSDAKVAIDLQPCYIKAIVRGKFSSSNCLISKGFVIQKQVKINAGKIERRFRCRLDAIFKFKNALEPFFSTEYILTVTSLSLMMSKQQYFTVSQLISG